MASANITVPLKEFGPLLEQLGKRAQKAAEAGVLSAAMRAQAIIVDETQKKRVFNTGYYIRAWKSARTITATSVGFSVINSAPYAGVIEEGRRPQPTRPRIPRPRRPRGSGPIPLENLPPFRKAIAAWVMRKFSLPYEEAYSRMWAISNAINRNGIPGRHVLAGAIPIISQAAREEVERELRAAMTRRQP